MNENNLGIEGIFGPDDLKPEWVAEEGKRWVVCLCKDKEDIENDN